MKLPGWYVPRYRFEIDGRVWNSDGHAAFAGEPPPGEYANPKQDAVAASVRIASDRMPVTLAAPCDRGYRKSNSGSAYEHKYVSAAYGLFGSIAWRDDGSSMGPIVGFTNGVPMVIIMPVRPSSSGHGFPPCAACNGDGKSTCDDCEGTGEVDHECSCGEWHEHECGSCHGTGSFGQCVTCGGDGRWREPAE